MDDRAGARVAVVTGAGRGIGLALARRLVREGYRIVVTDVEGEAASTAARELGSGCVGVQQDVRDVASHDEVAALAAELGQLRLWVNNAGIAVTGPTWEAPAAELTALLEVNVRGTIAGSGAAVRAMRDHGGAILNISSVAALAPVPGLALYAATKAAVLSYTTSLQGDLRHAGLPLRAFALCPDVVATRMVTDHRDDPEAAILFSGPKAMSEEKVADAAVRLLGSRQVFRVVPRWRGLVVRSSGLAPAPGLVALSLLRKRGERRQSKS